MSDARPTRPGEGAPPRLSVGESWPVMVAELAHDKARNRLDSDARRLVERLVDPTTFTEIGGLVGLGPSGSATSDRVPGEVVAGWGDHRGRTLFIAADEILTEDVPRNPAGVAVAGNVHLEAFRRGSPFVSFVAARRLRPDTWSAAAFTRVGLQLDLELERRSWATIPKIAVLAGGLDRVALLEAAFAHYVVARRDVRVDLPDGRTVDADHLARLGWADAVCDGEHEILDAVESVLAVVPDNAWTPAPDRPPAPPTRGASLVEGLVDGGTFVALSGEAPGETIAGLARLAGVAVAVTAGAVAGEHDRQRLVKVRSVCATLGLPLVLIDGAPGQSYGNDAAPTTSLIVALAALSAGSPRPVGADIPIVLHAPHDGGPSVFDVGLPDDVPQYRIPGPGPGPGGDHDRDRLRAATAELLAVVRPAALRRRRPVLATLRWPEVERTGPAE